MDVPESSTKRRKKDGGSSAPAPAPLATSSTNPPCVQPMLMEIYLQEDGSFGPCHSKFQKGTTALAFIIEEGIIVAADRSSKTSKSADNIVELNSHMLAATSGGGEFLLQKLKEECCQQEKEGRKTSVEDALKWLAKRLEDYYEDLSGILLAAWNESECELYCMNGKGEVVKNDIFATGSGSEMALTVMEVHPRYADSYTHSHNLRSRPGQRKHNMSVTEAAEVAKGAICFAASVAPHNGDIVSVYHLGSGGCKTLLEDDLEEWQKANLKCEWTKYKVIGKGW